MNDDEYAVAESPERAVTRPTRKGRLMKARLLKQWGGMYAGQILSNVTEGDYPAGVAEYFENDDPAIVEVREPGRPTLNAHVTDENGEVEPLKGSDFAKGQEAKVKAVEEEHVANVARQQDAIATKAEADEKAAEFEAKTQAAAKSKAKVKGPTPQRARANLPTSDPTPGQARVLKAGARGKKK